MNFWFWLFMVVPPALVLSGRPEENDWLKMARLVGAVALAVLLGKLVAAFDERVATEVYAECLARIPSGELEAMRFDCTTQKYRAVEVRDLYFYFFWTTSVGYAAAFEIIRRIWLHPKRPIFCRKNLISNMFPLNFSTCCRIARSIAYVFFLCVWGLHTFDASRRLWEIDTHSGHRYMLSSALIFASLVKRVVHVAVIEYAVPPNSVHCHESGVKAEEPVAISRKSAVSVNVSEYW